MAFQFGSGVVWLTPIGGNLAVNPTPVELGTIESASCEFAGTLKELVGFLQFPDDVAVGEKKVTGKITMGRIDAFTFNQVFFADAISTPQTNDQYNEAKVITTGAATVVPPGSGTYVSDLGVIYGSGPLAGKRFQKVASGPAIGQYANSGTTAYTFNTGDNGVTALISYQYTIASTGVQYAINNQPMGYGPVVELDFLWGYQSGYTNAANAIGIHLYQARISKITFAAKNTDYVKPEFDYSAFANGAGQVGYLIQNAN